MSQVEEKVEILHEKVECKKSPKAIPYKLIKEPHKNNQRPILEVNVNLEKGKCEKLVLYKGEDLNKILQEFATKHSNTN